MYVNDVAEAFFKKRTQNIKILKPPLEQLQLFYRKLQMCKAERKRLTEHTGDRNSRQHLYMGRCNGQPTPPMGG